MILAVYKKTPAWKLTSDPVSVNVPFLAENAPGFVVSKLEICLGSVFAPVMTRFDDF